MERNNWVKEEHENDIAIISMNGRYAGADTVEIFWDKVKHGVDFTKGEDISRNTNEDGLIKVKTQLENIDLFDADFFDYSKREAEIMDPQHRLFMECVWESLEKAGYDPENYSGTIGLYGGCNASSYLINNLLPNKELIQSLGDIQVMISNDKDHLTSQTAYKLNLKGPCMTVQTSCSTSLVAVHLGCESLLNGQCDIAIAGGVTLKIPQQEGYQYKSGGLVSEDGYCRPFDTHATGTVYSNGIGVVVLKRLNDAIEDGDTVHAVIKSSAINNDGADRVGYTAPGVNGQCSVISEALEVAQIHPDSIGYVEAHGSGTPMGDAIEIEAITQAYSYYTDRKGYCALGSVKSNIGHLEMASGVTGLIKAALCVRDGVIPPSLHFQEPNPDTDWQNSPFYVNGFLQPWHTDEGPRRAGVSSFGLGGNNAHIIIEQPPSIFIKEEGIKKENKDMITISARTETSLYKYCEKLGKHLEEHEEHHLNDVAYTFNRGRKRFSYKCAIPIKTRKSIIHILENIQDYPQYMCKSDSRNTKVNFVFGPTLSLSHDQIRELCNNNLEISKHIDNCHRLMMDNYGVNLKDILLNEVSREYLHLKSFIIQYAIAKGLMDKGLCPSTLVGDGIGLFVAAAIASVLSLRECIERLYLPHKVENIEAGNGKIPVISWCTHEKISIDSIGNFNYWEETIKNCNCNIMSCNKDWLLNSQSLAIDIGALRIYSTGSSSDEESNSNASQEIIDVFCKTWLKGCIIDWDKYYANSHRKRIVLPTYPFERKRHWVNPPVTGSDDQSNKEKDIDLISPEKYSIFSIHQRVKSVWEKALGVKIEHDTDSFFNLGGHSLLATQILFTLKEIFKVDISLMSFLEQPSIEGLSNSIWSKLEHQDKEEVQNSYIPSLVIDEENRYQPFNLTDVQKAYWIGRSEGMKLGNVSTHIYFEKDISQLDHHTFSHILNQLIQRHDMLRAIILPEGKQVVLKEVPKYDMRIHNLKFAQEEVRDAKLQEIRDTMSHQMISTDKWPLFDICLSQISSDKTRIHISFDLLITDAWSLELLLKEFMTLYNYPKHQLPPLELSYRDYIQALEAIKETDLYKRSRDYWLNRIDILPPAPQLPIDTKPSEIKTPRFKRYEKLLDKSKWTQLKAEGKKLNITPTCILITAFSEILGRWVSDPHFLINLTVFNRLPIHPHINNIVGDFTSLTLLEINNRLDDTFNERAARIQNQLWQDMDNRYFNGVEVTRELIKKTNDPSNAIIPIVFTSLLNVDNQEKDGIDLGNSNNEEDVFVISQTPQVWLDHQVIEREDSLYLNWDVLENIFPDKLIDNMFAAYSQLLEKLVLDSTQWNSNRLLQCIDVSMVETLNKHKDVQLLESNTLHGLVNKQVVRQPNRTAIIYQDLHITYKQLDEASNRVAIELMDKGVREGDIVGIFMDKGWEQIVAACGILKIGAAYLPIDKSLPQNRIEYILKLSEVQCVIIQDTSNKDTILPIPLPIVTINKSFLDNNYNKTVVQTSNTDSLAYIIFTSGSTGEPKGVEMSHIAVINTLLDINKRFSVNCEDRILGLSSLSFDLSVYDIFGILIAGGTLIIPDLEQKKDPWEWYQLIQQHHITVWNSVPAFMKLFIEGMKVKKMECPTLRLVMLSGDWIPISLPHKIHRLNNDIEVVSLGGATEAAIWSIIYPIKEMNPQWKRIPYGYSMVNQCVYVLNNKLEICPTWVYGNLYIGGKGLAIGYFKDNEKTEEKFIIHPVTGERLYHTGDLGRYLPDGTIELLGREDNQVKINGYRIELGEVESILKKHESVEDVIALAVEDAGKKKIVSYVKTNDDKVQLPDDIIVDPVKRFEFKLCEHQIRQAKDKSSIPLKRFYNNERFFKRRSYRTFSENIISFDTFSHFMESMSLITDGDKHSNKYMYGSSGGLYPVQLYLYVKNNRIENLAGGIYYYNPKDHMLVSLADTIIEPEVHVERNQAIFEQSAFSLFLIGEEKAIVPMYGKKESFAFMNLEAGIMTQLLEMTSVDYNIGLCQIGSIDFDKIRKHFQLDESHVYLHCLLGGNIDLDQIGKDGFMEELGRYEHSIHSMKEQNTVNDHSLEIQLKEYLAMHLPSYMIPSDIYRVHEFPITSNGKIDYKQLQKLKQPKLHKELLQYEAPRNEMEYTLTAIWQDIFQVEKVSVIDSFFDQGGDSISIIQIFNRLQEMGYDTLRLIDLFKYPTIRLLADYMNTNNKEPVYESLIDDEKRRAQARKKRLQQLSKNKNGE
ncbi:amino acid adenylation domain-containing protein [Vallitalea maricola]|uniref:Uncharacterized protein n=1 Tax=Vallitalea maricola TaxID=3074433 RepID=A0ACB5UKI3_9FIRM|nr:hypothetical protein AN2V17_22080 [Vallitalea sp. AN17-2]